MKKLLIIFGIAILATVGVLFATNPTQYVGYFVGPAAQQGQQGFTYGIDSVQSDLYIVERNVHRIYRVTTSGSIVSSFNFPPQYPMGVTYDGTYVWISRGYETGSSGVSAIYKFTTAGSQVSYWTTQGCDPTSQYPTGVEWDGTYVWYCDRYTNKIYKCTTTGSRVQSYYAPGSYADPNPRDLDYEQSTGKWWVQEANPASTPIVFSLFRCNSSMVEEVEYPYAYWYTSGGTGLLNPSGTDGFNPRGIYHDVPGNMYYISDCQYPGASDLITWVYKVCSGTRVETTSMGRIKSLYH